MQASIAARIRMLQGAADAEERQALLAEQGELAGRRELMPYREDVTDEIKQLGLHSIVDAALAECNTQKVTLEQGFALLAALMLTVAFLLFRQQRPESA